MPHGNGSAQDDRLIEATVRDLGDWRGTTLSSFSTLIKQAHQTC